MIDKMLVTVVAGALTVVLAMQLFLLSLPLFRRLEYDAVCHKYTLLMDRAGGLDDVTAARLMQDLGERGFTVTQLNGTSSAPFGANLDLLVTSSYPSCSFSSDLSLEEVSVSLTYQSGTICRVLKSYAEVP